jgi:hypothetical protein
MLNDLLFAVHTQYDWRLPPHVLEERDGYFSELKSTIESMYTASGKKKVVLIAHSLGTRAITYFLRWAEKTHGRAWISAYVQSYVAIGPLFLGAPKSIRATVCRTPRHRHTDSSSLTRRCVCVCVCVCRSQVNEWDWMRSCTPRRVLCFRVLSVRVHGCFHRCPKSLASRVSLKCASKRKNTRYAQTVRQLCNDDDDDNNNNISRALHLISSHYVSCLGY